MALVKCPECGREKVSATAISCPDCGFNIKEYFEKNPKELYISEQSEVYCNVLDLKGESIFANGLENGTSGKCIEGTLVWDYHVEDNILYITRRAGTVSYKIVDDYLINQNGMHNGYIPEQDCFNATCSKESFLGGIERITFGEDGSYTSKTDGKVGTTGRYKRSGNLIAIKSLNSGNKANGFIIYDNCYYIACCIKKSEMYKVEELINSLNNEEFIPSMIGTPARTQVNNTISVKCPYCQSTNTKKIGTIGRSFSFGLFGFGSSKVGKQWHCNACNSDF